jgi:hypothetical protein
MPLGPVRFASSSRQMLGFSFSLPMFAGLWSALRKAFPVRRVGIVGGLAILLGAVAQAQTPHVALPATATVGGSWVQQTPATSPPAREFSTTAYDAATGTVVLFGGYGNSGTLADTWTYNGTTWTQQSPATSPPRGLTRRWRTTRRPGPSYYSGE